MPAPNLVAAADLSLHTDYGGRKEKKEDGQTEKMCPRSAVIQFQLTELTELRPKLPAAMS